MTGPTPFQIAALAVFLLALAHVFAAPKLVHAAHRYPRHGGILHLLGEVEVVFGFWAAVLFVVEIVLTRYEATVHRLESLNFTEPLFVFAIMVMAGCRPVQEVASSAIDRLARLLPLPRGQAAALVVLGLAPLLGSLITEPAAMTVAALQLRSRVMAPGTSTRLRYAALATLFVNISIGGVFTSYAAPPVLMVAGPWGWDSLHMMGTFGIRALPAVLFNAVLFTVLFRRELAAIGESEAPSRAGSPWGLRVVHLALVAAVVLTAHHPILFIALLLFFLGLVQAYRRHHDTLLLREALLVGFFLAGLVVLGSVQGWWLSPLVGSLGDKALFVGATGLTAVVDNAALTYLGTLIEGTSESFRYHLLAGAVTGGGLTLIANAPNPAGAALLRERFPDGAISPVRLLLWASAPTAIALVAFGI